MQNRQQKYSFSNTGEVQTYQEQDDALIITALLCKVNFVYDEHHFRVVFTREQETKLRAEFGEVS